MTYYRITCLVGFFCLLLALPVAGQEGSDDDAYTAMRSFLNSWLAQENEAQAMGFFNMPAHEVAGSDYGLDWELLNRIWAPPTLRDSSKNTLSSIDPDLKRALVEELEVEVKELEVEMARMEPFTVFVADSDVVVNSFDAGFGDAATTLTPTENRVLTMIADFANGDRREDYPGPFIAFWSRDQNGEWKIQALGAAPEGRIFRDGK